MREIKFRAWHKYGKSAFPAIPGMVYDKNPGDCLTWLNQGQEIESVMQYTGLEDRNGVEIYEGDIVTIWHEELFCEGEQTGVIEWGLDGGWIIVFDSVSMFLTSIDWGYAYPLSIGNIYENPDLLSTAPGDEEGT